MKTAFQLNALTASMRTHWASLAAREQTLVLSAAAVLGLALLWWLLLAPVFEALLWPVATLLLLAPQRRAPDPDQNRPL